MAKAGSGGIFLHSCAISLLSLQLLPAGEGRADFKVLGPDSPILATVGEDALLPCRLSLNLSAEDMELRWYRSRPSPAVYLHRRGAQVSREQMAEYRGRTTFLGDHLARGEAVLRIHNVTVYDNGTYHCLFRDGEPHSETTLALQVAGLGLEPRIHVTEDLDKGIRAECTSAGWYPEPHVEWRDFRGRAVPAVTRFSASATTGLLAVLSRVAVPDRSMGGLTCSISSPLLHERKVAESHLPVSPSLDPATASPKLSLSEDQKSVRRLLFDQDLSPSASRFDQDPCVLAQEQFFAGQYYWEVEVGDRKAWMLGVCLGSVGREGRVPKAPQHGLWAVEFYKERLQALTYPRTQLRPPRRLCRVGVFLDCDRGKISFHNAADGSLVYAFSGLSFAGPLQPFLCLWTHDPSPLTFCPVVRETQEDAGGSRDPGSPALFAPTWSGIGCATAKICSSFPHIARSRIAAVGSSAPAGNGSPERAAARPRKPAGLGPELWMLQPPMR
ncbi:butyrophilin subfamily 1 member A1-like [Lepus europaeus]|uniref:butyrophilin subfamily 1 member A1-like n=1 Tax=Lepus europaeus TaxID=9983 RepID=UPI002B46670B|nr:butyrophilin subfamily 1 member A1-like [Lepus europaeus]